MHDAAIVFAKIIEMFFIIASGWAIRRANWLPSAAAAGLSRVVTDIAFPCLVFTQLIQTIDAEKLSQDWYLPLLGVLIILISAALGYATMRFFAKPGRRATYVFLAATPNWVFLPLPIAEALYAEQGVTIILLFSVGAQAAFWSLGVAILRGQPPDAKALRSLLLNPGFLSCVAGLPAACFWPQLRALLIGSSVGKLALSQALTPAFYAAAGLGSITIPVSLLLIGVAMGGMESRRNADTPEMLGILLTRLVLPLPCFILFFRVAQMFGWHATAMVKNLAYLVACMPVAISASVMAERFSGDAQLSARAIFLTSLVAIITIPLLVMLTANLNF